MTNITRIQADIFSCDAEVLVNPVNTVGVMGAGLALEFKRRFPAIWEPYRRACQQGDLKIGKVQFVKVSDHTNPKWIANFPTKDEWRAPSKLEYIRKGLESLVQQLPKLNAIGGWRSIAIPALGCGLGGLSWHDVEPLIHDAFFEWEQPVMVFPPRWEDQ